MKTTILLTLLSLSSLSQGAEITSKKIAVNAAKITERIVLALDGEKELNVQIVQEFIVGATDVSNTSRIIFSIAQLRESSDASASFVLTESISLKSAKEISDGVFEVTYSDAVIINDSGPASMYVTKKIDAKKAINDVLKGCPDFESCNVKTSVSFK